MACFVFELSNGTQEFITAERYLDAVVKLHKKVKGTDVVIDNYTVHKESCKATKEKLNSKGKVILDEV